MRVEPILSLLRAEVELQFQLIGLQHEAALADFLNDFDAHHESDIPAYFAERDWTHAKVVSVFDGWTRGEGLPDQFTPCFTFFALDSQRILGVYNIRNLGLNSLERWSTHVGYSVRPTARGQGVATAMLADSQQFAAKYGMEALTLTCDEKNIASRRVIEKRGGRLVDRYPENGRITLRFLLPTCTNAAQI